MVASILGAQKPRRPAKVSGWSWLARSVASTKSRNSTVRWRRSAPRGEEAPRVVPSRAGPPPGEGVGERGGGEGGVVTLAVHPNTRPSLSHAICGA